jgi:hypothetical protein
MTWLKDLPTPLAIACLSGLAVLDMLVMHESALAVAVISGLLGWMSHRAIAPASETASSTSPQP